MSDIGVTYAVLGALVALMAWNRFPVGVVALGAGLALYAAGVLDVEQVFAGFGDPVVAMIASLFVVSEALEIAGVTAWVGVRVGRLAGTSGSRLLVVVMLLCALLTSLISVNGAVAALIPMVVLVATRVSHPSQLLMPLAFAAHAGSILALTGTPVNMIVSEAAEDLTGSPFGFFEFALVGVPLVAGTLLIAVLLAPRVLPRPDGRSRLPDFSLHGTTLAAHYSAASADVTWLEVLAGSPLVGTEWADLRGRSDLPVGLLGTHRVEGTERLPVAQLAVGDVLVARGTPADVEEFAADAGLAVRPRPAAGEVADALVNRDYGVVEVLVHPRSDLIGTTVFPGMVTDGGELVVLAVQRAGEDRGPGVTSLHAGDLLLLRGQWDELGGPLRDPDVVVVDDPVDVRRHAVPLGRGSRRAIAVLVAMVVAMATGVVPVAVAALVAACAMVVTRVVTVEQAYRGVSWTTIVLVGAMFPVSGAVEQSGAAAQLADLVVDVVGDLGPRALLVGLFVFTAVLGQLISNMATALIVIPIAASAAFEMGVSPEPVLMAVTVAAAASFLTPVATPANLMVQMPGGYRFGDYWKLGLPLLLWFFVVAVFVVPLFWSF